ncbi:hypothetical protein M514_01746 [Trichuris suis]|uniref:Uncharacterized protein n=1 Tax=Trichuris suis TaxID=68888 RepID=A0A085MJ39_9BILA|nr:hypothetical protein M513_01746 [Trichuris suis]KFD72624.1 hypothetical protein M514_01746 [Trichuris suis]KHJ46469.1 hypothetical protein D918_03522 [Trichuris suis]
MKRVRKLIVKHHLRVFYPLTLVAEEKHKVMINEMLQYTSKKAAQFAVEHFKMLAICELRHCF